MLCPHGKNEKEKEKQQHAQTMGEFHEWKKPEEIGNKYYIQFTENSRQYKLLYNYRAQCLTIQQTRQWLAIGRSPKSLLAC